MTTQTPFAALLATQALGGVGYAFIFVPLSVLLFKTVPGPAIASALALTRLVQQIGGSVGSALAATLLDRGYANARAGLAPSISLAHPAIASFVQAHGAGAIGSLDALVGVQALNLAAEHATQFFALVTMAAAALPFVLASTRRARPKPSAPFPALPAVATSEPRSLVRHSPSGGAAVKPVLKA